MQRCTPEEHGPNGQRPPVLKGKALERAARLFRAMGDEPRLELLQLLARKEWCVTELVDTLEEKFSTISQRLRLLRTEGLVTRRRDGTHIFYSLADRHVLELLKNALAHAEELETPSSAKS